MFNLSNLRCDCPYQVQSDFYFGITFRLILHFKIKCVVRSLLLRAGDGQSLLFKRHYFTLRFSQHIFEWTKARLHVELFNRNCFGAVEEIAD